MFYDIDSNPNVYPTIIPNWDHSPRSGKRSTILTDSSPENFAVQVETALEITKNKEENIIFLKSWNEWGEGNYMEPDLQYAKGYITTLRQTIDKLQ